MRRTLKVMTVSSFVEQNYSLTAKYQTGERWNLQQEQELILSLIESFHIPEILLDCLKDEIIDGQQRTRAMKRFIENKYFIPYKGNKVYYSDLSKKDKDTLLGYNLYIVHIEGTEEDITIQFRRINNGTPLNNAEKRNAECTNFKEAVNLIANEHPLFKEIIKGTNDRRLHSELVSSLIFLEMKEIESITTNKLIDLFKVNAKGISEEYAKRVTNTLDYMYSACKANLATMNNCTTVQMYTFVTRLIKSQNYISPKQFGEFYFLNSPSWKTNDSDYKLALNNGIKQGTSLRTRFDKILNSYLKHFDPDFESFNEMCYAKDAGRIIDVLSKVHNKRKQA